MSLFVANISIHAPRAGRNEALADRPSVQQFQSMYPMRGATAEFTGGTIFEDISIHVPHTGHNYVTRTISNFALDFNLCTPYGVQLNVNNTIPIGLTISTHAPHVGCNKR